MVYLEDPNNFLNSEPDFFLISFFGDCCFAKKVINSSSNC